MTEPTDADYATKLAEALVLEIKAEMGRQDLSSRALGRLIGESSQYVSMRLDGGNPRTGLRVPLNVRDLASIASALGLDSIRLLERADRAMSEAELDELELRRLKAHHLDVSGEEDSIESFYDEPSAAEPKRSGNEGELDPDLQ